MGPRGRGHDRAVPERRALRALLALALLTGACTAAPPPPASAPLPSATVATLAPSPTPTALGTFLALLADRDLAQLRGDVARIRELVDPSAPEAFLERELALVDAIAKRPGASAPRRSVPVLRERDGLFELRVGELDDQGRVRAIRYFARGRPDALRLTEPPAGTVGAKSARDTGRVEIRSSEIDSDAAAVAAAVVEPALDALVARLGEAYRPRAKIPLELAPTVIRGVPALGSAIVDNGRVTLLTSASLPVSDEPGALWTRTVIAHELAHVMLFQRGNGTFLFSEGIPLWLTDDRRQPQLDRLVAARALWTLDHLSEGPSDAAEFYPAYAQASSFVRFVATTYGEAAVLKVWEAGTSAKTLRDAFRTGTGADADAAYAAWVASLQR